MKKILLSLSALLLVTVMMVSCGKNSSKEVANTWLTSFYHMDYDAAKKVSTPETDSLISQLQQLAGMISDSSKKEMKKIVITVKDVKENGDKAEATYTVSDNPGKDLKLPLVKKDGKWLVQFSKTDSMNDAGADQPAATDSTMAPGDSTMGADTMKH